jgi:hypothetical protein
MMPSFILFNIWHRDVLSKVDSWRQLCNRIFFLKTVLEHLGRERRIQTRLSPISVMKGGALHLGRHTRIVVIQC